MFSALEHVYNCENFDSIGHRIRKRIMTEKPPLLHFVCFQMPIGPQSWSLLIIFSEKLPLSQQLCYFGGGRYSQCFIPSTDHIAFKASASVFKASVNFLHLGILLYYKATGNYCS